MATFIIADLHLSENKPVLTNAFANFYEKNLYLNDHLIITGDLFDMFVGVDKDSRFHKRIRDIVLNARKRGVTTYFQCGNRDFLMDQEACKFFGMKLIGDFYAIPTVNGHALLIHGDQLCMGDRSYQRFRALSKSRLIRFIFMALPLTWRKTIGKKIRNKSQYKNNERDSDKHLQDEKVKKMGTAFLNNAKCNILIHGHFHVFGGENNAFGPGTHRIGLGIWRNNYSYVKVDRNELRLVQRPMEKNF